MPNWQYTPYIFPLIIAATISLTLALLAWRHRSAPGTVPFVWLMLAVVLWSAAYTLRLSSADLPTKLIWSKIRYVGIVVVPTAWLILALRYTHRDKWLTRRNLALLAVEPLLTLLLVWTNEFHHLIWREAALAASGDLWVWQASHGLGFWLHATYSYLLLLLGSLLLIQEILRLPRTYRGQVGVLLAGALAPVVGNVLSTFNLIPFPLDLTPFGFTLAGLIAAWGLFNFRLLDIAPVARDALIEGLSDSVIALDTQNRIVDLNPAARELLGSRADQAIGHPVSETFARWADLIERYRNVMETHEELAVDLKDATRWYDLRISPLHDRSRRPSGRLIVLREITERKRAERAMRAQKQLFENLVAVARATAEQPSLEATLQNALNVAAELTGATHGTLFLLDEAKTVRSILTLGIPEPQRQESRAREVMDGGLAGWVAVHREVAIVDDIDQDERWSASPDDLHPVRSALCAPIASSATSLGVLTLTHPQAGHFSTDDAQLLQAAADQMALAIRNAQMYEEQRQLARRQLTLYEVLATVGRHLDLQTIAQTAVQTVAQLTQWPAVAVLLPDTVRSQLAVVATAGAYASGTDWRLPTRQSVTGRAFRTAQTQHVPNVAADPEYVAGHPAIRSELAVPLHCGERIIGVLDIASDREAAFDDEGIKLAESLAEAIGLALDNARLYEEANQQASDMSALYTITRMVSRSLALEDVLNQALPPVLLSLGLDGGLISLEDAEGQLHLAAEYGLPSALSGRLHHQNLRDMPCNLVHRQRQSLFLGDLERDAPEALKPVVVEISRMGLRAYAGIPMIHQQKSLGVVSLFAHKPRSFSPSEMHLLESISHQIATAVANARLFQAVADERGRLQALIDASRDGIVLIDVERRIQLVNGPTLTLMGMPGTPDDWIGRPLRDGLAVLEGHAADAVQTFAAEMARIKTGNEPPAEGEFEVAAHTIHWLSLPVLTDSTPLGRLLVLRDVTEERLLEKMRDDLTHAMVHDLRNPLTSLTMSLQLLDAPYSDNLLSHQRTMLEMAIHSADRVSKLVNNILDVSQLESGKMPLDRAALSLDDLVEGTLRGQSLVAAQKGVTLESHVPAGLPLIWGDEPLLERVLQNLVDNAIKFMPHGGRIEIAAQEGGEESTTGQVRVSISDNGPGIPFELQERLFEKFVTGDLQDRGSGLGLTFCKLTVEAHGGRIWVESAPGQGATFTLTLPVAPDNAAPDSDLP
jgi:PAS domain S-box-containing protein